MENLREIVRSGLRWTSLGHVSNALVGVLKIAILARLLSKADFGLMAIVMVVIQMSSLVLDAGLSVAILHDQDTSDKAYASLYWINLCLGFLLYLLLLLAGPWIADFYQDVLLQQLIPVVSLNILFMALGRHFFLREQKALNFRLISTIEIIATICSFLVAVIYAYLGHEVWSLVYSELVRQAILNLFFFLKGLRSRQLLFYFQWTKVKPLLRIGGFAFGAQIANNFNRDMDVLVLGKFFDTSLVGGYSLAKQLVYRPMQIYMPVISRVAVSVFPKFQKDDQVMRERFKQLLKVVSTLSFMSYLLVFITADLLVGILYGPEYTEIVILVRILSVYVLLRALARPMGPLIVGTGKTDYSFYWNIAIIPLYLIFVGLGATYSLEWAAISLVALMLCLVFLSWYFIVYKLTGLRLDTFLKALWPAPRYTLGLLLSNTQQDRLH